MHALGKLRISYLPALGLLFFSACSAPVKSLPIEQVDPIRFPLEDFTLTERSGKKVSKSDFSGKVWIASFVFTRCTSGCPQITATMARLQADFADQPDVRLVTFTVDPERDDPAELRKYAEHFQADRDRWLFLTGQEKEIHRLLQESFKVTAMRNEKGKPGDEFTHDSKLVVIDRHGNVRGYFGGMVGATGAEALEADLKNLKNLVNLLISEK